MSRVLVFAAASLTGLALLTGCTKDDAPKTAVPAATIPATAGPEQSADPQTAAPDAQVPQTANPGAQPTQQAGTTPKPAGATPPVAAVRFGSPQEALDHLLAAWNEGDRAAALQAAGPRTVEKVFAGLHKGAEKQIEGCDRTDEIPGYAYNCYWRYEGGSTHFYVNPYAPTGYRVENYEQIAD